MIEVQQTAQSRGTDDLRLRLCLLHDTAIRKWNEVVEALVVALLMVVREIFTQNVTKVAFPEENQWFGRGFTRMKRGLGIRSIRLKHCPIRGDKSAFHPRQSAAKFFSVFELNDGAIGAFSIRQFPCGCVAPFSPILLP